MDARVTVIRPVIRPMKSADGPLLQEFVRNLSPQSRRMRFQTGLSELYPTLLDQLMPPDDREHLTVGAMLYRDGREAMVGEARYAPAVDTPGAIEFAIAVADEWHGAGLGSALMGRLLQEARSAGLARMQGDVLRDNAAMLRLAERFGFRIGGHPDGAWLARVTLDLRVPARSPLPDRAVTHDLEVVA